MSDFEFINIIKPVQRYGTGYCQFASMAWILLNFKCFNEWLATHDIRGWEELLQVFGILEQDKPLKRYGTMLNETLGLTDNPYFVRTATPWQKYIDDICPDLAYMLVDINDIVSSGYVGYALVSFKSNGKHGVHRGHMYAAQFRADGTLTLFDPVGQLSLNFFKSTDEITISASHGFTDNVLSCTLIFPKQKLRLIKDLFGTYDENSDDLDWPSS